MREAGNVLNTARLNSFRITGHTSRWACEYAPNAPPTDEMTSQVNNLIGDCCPNAFNTEKVGFADMEKIHKKATALLGAICARACVSMGACVRVLPCARLRS